MKDEQTAEEVKLADGQTIHLVYKPAPKQASEGAPKSSEPSTQPSASSSRPAAFNPLGGAGGFSGFPSMMSGGGPTGLGGLNMDPN